MKAHNHFKFHWLLFVFIPLSIIFKFTDINKTYIFLTSALSIIPLVDFLSKSTEMVALRTTPTIAGLLNASLGNLAELIICFFAIKNGYIEIVKASITGSIICNILFVFGLSALVGGLKYKNLRFNPNTAESGSAMLFLSVASLLVPSFFVKVGGITHQHSINSVSLFIAGILLLTYVLGIIFTLKTHRNIFFKSVLSKMSKKTWPLKKSILIVIASGVLISFMSELLVESTEETIATLKLSETFIGFIIIAIIGNAAEHMAAIFFAYKNKMDLALNITLGSSVQIALFIAPLLVFVSYLMGHPMPLVFTILEIIAVALSTGIIVILSNDGKSNWFEGCQLLALYIMLAVVFFFY